MRITALQYLAPQHHKQRTSWPERDVKFHVIAVPLSPKAPAESLVLFQSASCRGHVGVWRHGCQHLNMKELFALAPAGLGRGKSLLSWGNRGVTLAALGPSCNVGLVTKEGKALDGFSLTASHPRQGVGGCLQWNNAGAVHTRPNATCPQRRACYQTVSHVLQHSLMACLACKGQTLLLPSCILVRRSKSAVRHLPAESTACNAARRKKKKALSNDQQILQAQFLQPQPAMATLFSSGKCQQRLLTGCR